MGEYTVYLKSILAFLGGTIGYLYGGWSQSLILLLAFVTFDYITGIVAAGKQGTLDPKVGRYGVFKKIFIFIMVAIAHLLDITLNQHILMTAAIFWYAGQEFISITQNASVLGVQVPDVLTKAISSLPGNESVPTSGGTADGK